MATIDSAVLIFSKLIENTLTVQYTSGDGVQTIFDNFALTNNSASAVTVRVYLVKSGGSPDAALIYDKEIGPKHSYLCPEICRQVLESNGYVSTSCSAANALALYASGRKVTA